MSVVVLVVVAAVTVMFAAWPGPGPVVGVLLLVLLAGLALVSRARPGPVMDTLGVVAILVPTCALADHDRADAWLVTAAMCAVVAGLVDEPLQSRLVTPVRAVQLPGVTDDVRPRLPGPFTYAVWGAGALLAVLLVVGGFGRPPVAARIAVLVLVVAALAWSAVRLRTAVWDRRHGTVNREVTEALTAYAPRFFVYFSGPVEQDYQVRMWLPYLERVGVPFAILARDTKMLARAAGLTSAPLVVSERLAGLDDCMAPSVRAVFYVNTESKTVDGIRYLDRTHVHLNHGDSDKPSSFHPMIAAFDRIFVAGQAAVDRFAQHGVVVPAEKFVHVGRPQVADIAQRHGDSTAGRSTVLYAPTWRGGVRNMNFSSLDEGERIVRCLLDRGVRVIFRPHPISRRHRDSARRIAAVDAMLTAASTSECAHVTSDEATGPITEWFNRSDALVTDVSSVASDYLQSGKPFAVVDLRNTGTGQAADPDVYPVLRAAYLLDLADGLAGGLDTMLRADPLAHQRRELRNYYLGDHADSAESFVAAVRRVLGDTRS